MNILFVLRKASINKVGTASIGCRITVEGKSSPVFSTGVRATVNDWDAKNQKIKGKGKETELDNDELITIRERLKAIRLDFETKGKNYTAISVKALFDNPTAISKPFLELVQPCFQFLHQKNQHSAGTIKNYAIREKNMTLFLESEKMKKCTCEEITPALLSRFSVWLRMRKSSSNSHINKGLEAFQQVIRWAKMNGHTEKNEIMEIDKEKVTKNKIEYVEMVDILRIYNANIPVLAWRKVVDVFTFQCLTSLDYCDVKVFGEKHIYNGFDGEKRIKIVRGKSTKQKDLVQDLPFVPLAQEIWAKYEGKFPLISLSKYNKYLQEIYPFYDVDVHITSKISRKTAGTHWLDIDIPLEIVSKMLGHSKIQTTMDYYAKVKQKRAEKEQQKLYK